MQRALRPLGAASPACVARALLALLDAPPICCMYVYMNTYMYTYIEREKQRDIYIHTHTYIHIILVAGRADVARAPPALLDSPPIHIYIYTCIYIYTHIYTHTYITSRSYTSS
jgi:hypothetical protein